MSTAYVNGKYLPLESATVPAMDRGFLFSDGVYEIIPVYQGKPFRMEQHFQRLTKSLRAIQLESATNLPLWQEISQELIQRNGGGDQYIYLQVTRGPAPRRDYRFPETITPTLFAYTQPHTHPTLEDLQKGIAAITLPDIRWDLCHIKSISLLGSVLQRQKAEDTGADEGIFINQQGEVIEGTASNVFIVKKGTIFTPPKNEHMLAGITRDVILEIATEKKMPCQEKIISESELRTADEIWITSSLREIKPVLHLNNQPVGNAKPGTVWQEIIQHLRTFIAS